MHRFTSAASDVVTPDRQHVNMVAGLHEFRDVKRAASIGINHLSPLAGRTVLNGCSYQGWQQAYIEDVGPEKCSYQGW